MEQNISKEKLFLSDHNVKVTNARLIIVGGKTYVMSNISSVVTHRLKQNNTLQYLVLIVSLVLLLSDESKPYGLVFMALAIVSFFMRKPRYSLRIQSNSGESDGLTSKNKSYIDEIVAAVNEAVIYRG